MSGPTKYPIGLMSSEDIASFVSGLNFDSLKASTGASSAVRYAPIHMSSGESIKFGGKGDAQSAARLQWPIREWTNDAKEGKPPTKTKTTWCVKDAVLQKFAKLEKAITSELHKPERGLGIKQKEVKDKFKSAIAPAKETDSGVVAAAIKLNFILPGNRDATVLTAMNADLEIEELAFGDAPAFGCFMMHIVPSCVWIMGAQMGITWRIVQAVQIYEEVIVKPPAVLAREAARELEETSDLAHLESLSNTAASINMESFTPKTVKKRAPKDGAAPKKAKKPKKASTEEVEVEEVEDIDVAKDEPGSASDDEVVVESSPKMEED